METALKGLEDRLVGKNAEQINKEIERVTEVFASELAEVKESVRAGMLKEFDAEIGKVKDAFAAQLAEKQKHLDDMDVRLQKAHREEVDADPVKAYSNTVREALAKNADRIKNLDGRLKLEVKEMTIAGNLTGGAMKTYQPGVAANPSQKVNFADMVPTVQSATGIYVLYREGAATGAVAEQANESDVKATVDFNLTEVVYNATFLAGLTRFSKQMATDLPFLQSFLPMALRREYFKVENSTFQADLIASATKATNTATERIERIITDMGALEAADYDVNGVVLNPADWALISITKPGDFSLPATVAYVNGSLMINGVPVFKASWQPAGQYTVGQWDMAKKVVVDGLAIQFFEQDGTNVQENMITARIESRTVLAIDRPNAFVYGNLTGAQPV